MESKSSPLLPPEATAPYLVVSLGESLYGLDSLAVEEILLLPELTPIAEAPPDIIGVLDRRGAIVPVIDLNRRLGYEPLPYHIHDSVVVLHWQQQRLGLLVNRVREVQAIASAAIERDLRYGREVTSRPLMTVSQGIARWGDEIIVLLSVEALVRAGELAEPTAALEEAAPDGALMVQRRFFPDATPAERDLLRARAASLRQVTTTQDTLGFHPLAVIQLGEEVFALDLRLVREFAELRHLTPVPCCPPHIVGNTNLRGEIVTLIDIRTWLQLPPRFSYGDASRTRPVLFQAVIVAVETLVVGLWVDAVLDVLLLDPTTIGSVPTALQAAAGDYLQGTAPYGDRLMSLLDLETLLREGSLVVDETP